MKSRIVVRDDQGREIDLASLRPSAHSATLNAAVQVMLNAADQFDSSVAKSASHVHYTPEGFRDMAQGHASKAFTSIRTQYAAARQQAVGEREIASDRFDSALRRRLPPQDIVRVEIAKQLLSDARRRGSLVDQVKNNAELSFADIERIETGAVLPLALTGLTVEQRAQFRAFLVPEESAALSRANEALGYVDELCGTLVQKIAGVAKMGLQEVAAVAGPDVVATIGRISVRPLAVGTKGADSGTVGPVPVPSEDAEAESEAV